MASTKARISIHGKRLMLGPRGLIVDGRYIPDIDTGGTVYYVDPASGSDSSAGLTTDAPLKTLGEAHDRCVAGNNDIVVLVGDGGTTGTARLTEQLAWSKNATHLIGVTAPTGMASRARISHSATAPTTAFGLVLVTASGCVFSNFSLFEGFNEAAACVTWEDRGARNYYDSIHFGGMGYDAKSGDVAGSACLLLTGGGEHKFVECTFGLDTVARGAANANVRLASATARNVFKECMFIASCDAATPLFIDANTANSMGRWSMFDRCHFLNALNISPGATAMTAAIAVNASANGTIFVNACSKANTTDWTAADSGLVRLANMPTTSGDTGGEYQTSDAT